MQMTKPLSIPFNSLLNFFRLKALSAEGTTIASLALLKFLIHISTAFTYGLHRDEYLYIAQSAHLDFGFLSIPPLLPAMERVLVELMGDSILSVRLLPALYGVASIIVVGRLVQEFGGRRRAIIVAGVAFLLSPAFLRTNSMFMPVPVDCFFWLLSAFFLVRLINTQSPRYWIYLGLGWSVSFLNKYAIVFFALSIVISLLLSKHRSLYRSRYFLIGMGLGLLVIMPNLFWQYQHNWPVIWHMQTLQETQLVNVDFAGFLSMQLLMNLPGLIIWLAGLLFLLFSPSMAPYRVVGYTYLVCLIILVLLRGKAYYTLGAYPMLFAAGGVLVENLSRKFRGVFSLVLMSMIMLILPVLPFSVHILPIPKMVDYSARALPYGLEGVLTWEDGTVHSLPQDYADMTGWKEIAMITVEAHAQLDHREKATAWIYAENYGQAGAIRYYGQGRGLPEPMSFSDSFLFWAPDSIKHGAVLIYVNDELGEDIRQSFRRIRLAGRLENPHAREHGTGVWICRDPSPEFADFYAAKVARLKSRFAR